LIVARDKPLYFVGGIPLYSLGPSYCTDYDLEDGARRTRPTRWSLVAMYHIIVEVDDGSSPFRCEFHYGTRNRFRLRCLFRHKKFREDSACQNSYGDLQLSAARVI
jgi:hypothetical protein